MTVERHDATNDDLKPVVEALRRKHDPGEMVSALDLRLLVTAELGMRQNRPLTLAVTDLARSRHLLSPNEPEPGWVVADSDALPSEKS